MAATRQVRVMFECTAATNVDVDALVELVTDHMDVWLLVDNIRDLQKDPSELDPIYSVPVGDFRIVLLSVDVNDARAGGGGQ